MHLDKFPFIQVMGVNGVSHFVVEDDYAGVTEVLTWLSFVPATVGGPLLTLGTKDPINRHISYSPVGCEYSVQHWRTLVVQ